MKQAMQVKRRVTAPSASACTGTPGQATAATDPATLPRLPRRRLLSFASAAAALVGVRGLALGPRVAAAPPVAAGMATHLVAAISYAPGAYEGAARAAVETYIADHFASHHPGLLVSTVPAPDADRTSLAYQATVTAVLSGDAPDILAGTDYQLPAFADVGALVPLAALTKDAHIDMGLFSPGHLAALTRAPFGLVGLPAFDGPDVLLVNYSLLDAMGIADPSPDWTYLQATATWTQATRDKGSLHYYGVSLDIEDYVTELFGGSLMDASGTRCLLNSPDVLKAAEWLVPLILRKIAQPIADPPTADSLVRHGRAAFGSSPGGNVQGVVRDMTALGVSWDYLPMPYFPPFPPGHRMTYTNGEWYAMNTRSPHPRELVWALLRFLVLDPGYQQFMYRLTWVPPNRLDRWPDWLRVVRALAPVLRDKHLEYYAQAMTYATPDLWFRYHPYQADSILKLYLLAIASGELAPERGLAAATADINALQQGAASTSANH